MGNLRVAQVAGRCANSPGRGQTLLRRAGRWSIVRVGCRASLAQPRAPACHLHRSSVHLRAGFGDVMRTHGFAEIIVRPAASSTPAPPDQGAEEVTNDEQDVEGHRAGTAEAARDGVPPAQGAPGVVKPATVQAND